MTVDRWAKAVRDQVALGRLLPLGGPADGAWITEPAARAALRRAVSGVRGVRLGGLRLTLADPEEGHESGVPAPPSALPPGPLRLTADCAATADEPLPVAVDRLRAALAGAARERLGLVVPEVDLTVTELLDTAGAGEAGAEPEPADGAADRATDGATGGAAASSPAG
ncbi:nucleopolyhedrovirus P10 family protein, partial [Streptomyces beihaiensis]